MTLSAVEQTKFRAWLAHRLLLKIEILIPEYIYSNEMGEDIYDKGIESVMESYVTDASKLEFHWTPDPYGRS